MFKPNETALDVYRRLKFPKFTLNLNGAVKKTECISFGEIVEISCPSKGISDLVLDISFQFFQSFHWDGIFVHLSAGHNMMVSLAQSRLEISVTPLHDASQDGRMLSASIYSTIQFLAAIELLKSRQDSRPMIVVAENLSFVLNTLKGFDGNVLSEALLHRVAAAVESLSLTKHAIFLWVNPAIPRRGGSALTPTTDYFTVRHKGLRRITIGDDR